MIPSNFTPFAPSVFIACSVVPSSSSPIAVRPLLGPGTAGARPRPGCGPARRLGVSRNSVLGAYEAPAAGGLLAGRTGSGPIVRGAPPSRVDGRRILRDAHYPTDAVRLHDPDGNSVYLHR